MSWGEIYKRTPFGKLNNANGFGNVYKDIDNLDEENTEENGTDRKINNGVSHTIKQATVKINTKSK